MSWELNSNEPIYLQITEELKLRIASGEYPAGSQLPGVRILAQDASVNPNTVQKAFQELEREGLVYAQRTSGRFVTEDSSRIDEIKLSLAKEQVRIFIEKMNKLGINKETAAQLFRSAEEEEKQ